LDAAVARNEARNVQVETWKIRGICSRTVPAIAWTRWRADLLKKKPAARAGQPASISRSRQHRLDSEAASHSKAGYSNYSPADARPALADDRGESDHAFFASRPGVTTRLRLPFPDEFAICDLLGARAFVRVVIDRDADGLPKRGARRRRLTIVDGGTA
jgi:hypothetical protein